MGELKHCYAMLSSAQRWLLLAAMLLYFHAFAAVSFPLLKFSPGSLAWSYYLGAGIGAVITALAAFSDWQSVRRVARGTP
jgi:hypothetical protein